MKILLIYPNASSQLGFSYGLASISAVLKKAGYQVELIHLCEQIAPLPNKEVFLAQVADIAPDIIGFSVVTTQWKYTAQLAEWLKQNTPHITLVCGGPHPTMVPREVLETRLFDYVFAGECEEAFLEFVRKKEANENLTRIPNIGTRDNDNIVLNPVRPLPDLNKIPPKDYEVFDFPKIIDAKNGWVGLMTSRGCPFKCTYCFNHKLVQKYRNDLNCTFAELNYIRYENIGRIITEIDHLLTNYHNIKMFIFDDDLFTFDKSFVQEFCHAYREKFNIPFVVNGHIAFFDDDRARALATAGCRIVKFGVESGSHRIRNQIMRRHMTNDQIKEAINIVHRHGMHSSTFIMIGLPYETQDDVWATIRLLAEARPGRFRWTYFYPFPGTEAHRLSIEGGFIDDQKYGSLMNFTDDSCLDFGPEQNLFLHKIGRVMPWFVNAYAGLETSPFYRRKIYEVLALPPQDWQERAATLRDEDRHLSTQLQAANKTHYAIKYNRFMGVSSDYFMNEE